MTVCPACGQTEGEPEAHPLYLLCAECREGDRLRDRRLAACERQARATLSAVYIMEPYYRRRVAALQAQAIVSYVR